MQKELHFYEVPAWWAVCQNRNCPLKEKCLRYHAGSIAPEGTSHQCIISQQTIGDCRYFDELCTVRIAQGFMGIFNRVGAADARAMRRELMSYLGSATSKGTYYRYAHGERLLSPMQQAWISRLMQRYGYSPEVNFDCCWEDFRFKSGQDSPEYVSLLG